MTEQKYQFKLVQELAFAAFGAIGIFIFQVAADFDPETVQDWQTWAVALGGGLIRAAGVALLGVMGKAVVSRA